MEILKTNIENMKIENGILNSIKDVFKEDNALILRTDLDKVDFCYYDNYEFDWLGNKEIDEEFLLDLRVFNKDKELHIYRFNNEFRGRIINDTTEDEKLFIVRERNFMWGSKIEDKNNSFLIKEDRGIFYNLPKIFEIEESKSVKTSEKEEAKDIFMYESINYLKEDEDGILYNYDYRLSDVLYKGKKSILNRGDKNV